MGLFKSKQERKIERDLEIKRGIQRIRKQIGDLEGHERKWLEKARRAKQLGARDQLAFMKASLKKTVVQRRSLERALLMMEAAFQLQAQIESYGDFATSMQAISKTIGEVYQATDMELTQRQFEKAVAQAETLEERINLVFETTGSSMFGAEVNPDEVMSDNEIEQMIDAGIGGGEAGALDAEIEAEIKKVEDELTR